MEEDSHEDGEEEQHERDSVKESVQERLMKLKKKQGALKVCSSCKEVPRAAEQDREKKKKNRLSRLQSNLHGQFRDAQLITDLDPSSLCDIYESIVSLVLADMMMSTDRNDSVGRTSVTWALDQLGSGTRRVWRSRRSSVPGGSLFCIPRNCRTRLSFLFCRMTLGGPSGASTWPTSFVGLLIPPTQEEAHVMRTLAVQIVER